MLTPRRGRHRLWRMTAERTTVGLEALSALTSLVSQLVSWLHRRENSDWSNTM